ncbi:MAG: cytochrome c [Bdellovibrionaceae bacterium]|nr:cytochrome c [Pseudobdellovibrionaceae bacterium]
MKKALVNKVIGGTLGGLVLLVAFNNCGEGFVAERIGATGGGGSTLFSRAPGESCEDALLKVYQSSYHPFLNQTCNSCHINGPGIGAFASPDAKISYNSFVSTGSAKINGQAINDNHKPPYTGAQNTARVEELKSVWASAQTGYASCVAASNGAGGVATGFVVKSSGKTVPANLGTTTFVRMEWDLETLSAAKVPLIAGIEIRRAAIGGVTRGYEFRNPTLRVKTAAAGSYQARALNIYMNEMMQTEVTTYSNINMIVGTTTDLNLSPGTANAFAAVSVATTDTIGVEFSSLGSTTGAPNPGGGVVPTPTPTPGAITAMTFTQLTANGGIFRTSCIPCHTTGNARGGLDMTNYAATKLAAQNIKARVNNAANPMPTGGLLPQNQRDQINAWVDQGAPQ